MAHDSDLTAHVFDVDGGPELSLRDAFTREELARVAVDAEVSHAELAAPELAVDEVPVLDVLLRNAGEDSDRRFLLRSGGGREFGLVSGGEARFDILPSDSGRRSAAVSHRLEGSRRERVLGRARGLLGFHMIMRKP